MRDYAKVAPSFWTGATGRTLRRDRDAQVVALYLITAPTANMLGMYYLPLPVLSHETGVPIERAREVLSWLANPVQPKAPPKPLQSPSEAPFALYDENSETVFVPEMAAYQIGEPLDPKDNRVKAIVKEWQAMRKCCFYLEFYKRYADSFHLPAPENRQNSPSPSEAPLKPLRSQDQDQDQDQEQEQEQKYDHDPDQERLDQRIVKASGPEPPSTVSWQHTAERLARIIGADGPLLNECAWLVGVGKLTEAQIYDAANGINAVDTRPSKPLGYFRTSLEKLVGGKQALTAMLRSAPTNLTRTPPAKDRIRPALKRVEPLGPSEEHRLEIDRQVDALLEASGGRP